MRFLNWSQKLQVKATFIVIVAVAIILIIAEFVERAYVAELARENLENKSFALVRQFSARIQTYAQFRDDSLQREKFESLIDGIPELEYISLYEVSSQSPQNFSLRFFVGEKSPYSEIIPVEVPQAFMTQKPVSFIQDLPTESRIKVAMPINIKGQIAGVVYAEFWTGQFEALKKFYHRWSFIIRVGVGVLLVISINGFLYYWVLRPLSRLRKGVEAVARGEWGTQLPVTTGDELGDAADDFNAMTNHIQHVMTENQSLNEALQRSQQELQHRVDQATAELVQRNEELALLNEQLASAQRESAQHHRLAMLGQLVATIAHKVGTPLTSISGHLQLMLESPDVSQEVKQRVHTMLGQTDRLSKVIQDLLNLARTPTIRKEPVPLSPLIEQVCAMFFPVYERQGIEMILSIAPNVSTIPADPHALQEILGNLIDNAIDAMPDGGKISVTVFQDHSQPSNIVLEVADTGPGIPSQHQGRILDPFYTTKALGKGTGLGLAIANELVKLHGGTLSVRSEECQGTVFTITLPTE